MNKFPGLRPRMLTGLAPLPVHGVAAVGSAAPGYRLAAFRTRGRPPAAARARLAPPSRRSGTGPRSQRERHHHRAVPTGSPRNKPPGQDNVTITTA